MWVESCINTVKLHDRPAELDAFGSQKECCRAVGLCVMILTVISVRVFTSWAHIKCATVNTQRSLSVQ